MSDFIKEPAKTLSHIYSKLEEIERLLKELKQSIEKK